MDLELVRTNKLRDFFIENRVHFSEQLLEEAVNVRDKIDEIHRVGDIDLLSNAQRLALYVVDNQHGDLIQFAKQEGVAWAGHDLTVSFKLEWLQSIHRVLWRFLYYFDRFQAKEMDRDAFFVLEKKINHLMDEFFSSFFLSYSDYKEQQLKTQKELIENLSVPVIPLTDSMSILPLIGNLDSTRVSIIQEKLLSKISELKIKTLIIDFSGVPIIERHTTEEIRKLLYGSKMMGCKPIITGLRPDTVQTMVQNGVSFDELAETKGTLQKAMQEFF